MSEDEILTPTDLFAATQALDIMINEKSHYWVPEVRESWISMMQTAKEKLELLKMEMEITPYLLPTSRGSSPQ